MNILFRIIVLFLVIIIQTTLNVKLSIRGIFPNLVLLPVIYFSFNTELPLILSLAFWTGLALDSFSAYNMGANAFCFTLVAYATYSINKRLFIDDVLSRILLLLFSVFLYYLVYFFIIDLKHLYSYPQSLLFLGIPSFLYTSIFGALLFFLIYSKK